MKIKLNGREEDIPLQPRQSCTIQDLLLKKGIRPEAVAVELNVDIIHRSEYSQTCLKEGDAVEIVRFVGGGA